MPVAAVTPLDNVVRMSCQRMNVAVSDGVITRGGVPLRYSPPKVEMHNEADLSNDSRLTELGRSA